MADFTYKILKEKLAFIAISVVDITQANKPLAFGPSSHEDAEAVAEAMKILKAFIDMLVAGIKHGTLPSSWSTTLKELIMKEYSFIVSMFTKLTWEPETFLGDCAPALGNGTQLALKSVRKVKSCYTHIWRAIMRNVKKLADGTEKRVDMLLTDVSFISELTLPELKPHALRLFEAKWLGLTPSEDVMVAYLKSEFLNDRNFSRCDGYPGQPRSTNALERFNRHLKSENFFNSVEGAGTVILRTAVVGHRLSRDIEPFQMVPKPTQMDWKKAQKMIKSGWQNLGFKMGAVYVFPSEKLLEDHLPPDADTVEAKRRHIKTWAKEFASLVKNPTGYYKLTSGEWDFDILMDMMFSFWVLRPVPPDHKQLDGLRKMGITYMCSCPKFQHYHYCKHSIAAGLHFETIRVPLKFDQTNVGKRKAPAGASLTKRSRCLQVDD